MKAANRISGPQGRSRTGAILTSPRSVDLYFVIGLLLLSFEFVQIGNARLSQLWAIAMLALFLVKKSVRVQGREALAFGQFIAVALLLTGLSGYDRIKAAEQIVKFVVVYPAFYLVGRSFGRQYLGRGLPIGYVMLFAFLLIQFAVQKLNLPVLYHTVDFMEDSLHGTFHERNQLAIFFFCIAFLLFLQSQKRVSDVAWFLALGVSVALLSGSKTVLVPCGIVLITQIRNRIFLKIIAVVAGVIVYYFTFSKQLSGDALSVKLEQERGLAFIVSLGLVAKDWIGHGFGFVESYFATSPISVIGLGEGTNSIFCSPLDLMLIAGVPGVIAWLVFFGGVGSGWRTMLCLSPLAAWSLTNPIHQSELAYFICGYLVSWGRGSVPLGATRNSVRGAQTMPHTFRSHRFNRRMS